MTVPSRAVPNRAIPTHAVPSRAVPSRAVPNRAVPTQTGAELLRLHRRACTDFAARLRLPAWEHLTIELAPPLAPHTVGDLLTQVTHGNLKAAAALCGQPEPALVDPFGLDPFGPSQPNPAQANPGQHSTGQHKPELGRNPSPSDTPACEVVIESIRTVLTVAAGTSGAAAANELSPQFRELLWQRAAELTVLGYDLQQAIRAGAGLDELLVDRLLSADLEPNVWPYLSPLPTDQGTPPLRRLLALTGRPAGLWVDPTDPGCGTGQC